ncbi:MAG: hypothetical protein ABSH50_04345 [Bryobacteraceae bacterium]
MNRRSTPNFSPETLAGAIRMVMVVPDPDAALARAVADQPYGWRVGRVAGPFGHHWEIGKPLN